MGGKGPLATFVVGSGFTDLKIAIVVALLPTVSDDAAGGDFREFSSSAL